MPPVASLPPAPRHGEGDRQTAGTQIHRHKCPGSPGAGLSAGPASSSPPRAARRRRPPARTMAPPRASRSTAPGSAPAAGSAGHHGETIVAHRLTLGIEAQAELEAPRAGHVGRAQQTVVAAAIVVDHQAVAARASRLDADSVGPQRRARWRRRELAPIGSKDDPWRASIRGRAGRKRADRWRLLLITPRMLAPRQHHEKPAPGPRAHAHTRYAQHAVQQHEPSSCPQFFPPLVHAQSQLSISCCEQLAPPWHAAMSPSAPRSMPDTATSAAGHATS